MKKIKLILWMLIGVFILLICVGSGISKRVYEREDAEAMDDYYSLRNVIAEAYINIFYADPNFVNAATEEEPMVIPDQYYSHKESAMGDGRDYAVVKTDGSVVAYFGSPEKTSEYYIYGDHHSGHLSEKIYWATYWIALGFVACFISLYGVSKYVSAREKSDEMDL